MDRVPAAQSDSYPSKANLVTLRPLGSMSRCEAKLCTFVAIYHISAEIHLCTWELGTFYVYSILKPHGQSSRGPVRPLLSEAKPSYIYSILKPHSQSSVRLMSCEAKPSYVHTILKKHHLLRVGPKQLCALARLGCTRAAGTS